MSSRLSYLRAASLTLLGCALLGGCVDELVVGLRQPLQLPDAGDPLDAELPWEEDASRPVDAALADASEPLDGNVSPFDAGPTPDACSMPRCGPVEPGPCYGCDVILTFIPKVCGNNGAPETCWDNGDGICTLQCPDVASCKSSDECQSDEYCFFQLGDCGEQSLGVCAPRPTSCLDIVNSKCACDGIVYRSACVAAQAGQAFGDDAHSNCK